MAKGGSTSGTPTYLTIRTPALSSTWAGTSVEDGGTVGTGGEDGRGDGEGRAPGHESSVLFAGGWWAES